ncbi:MAG: GNAT family N-acetyltransferase [Fidelibacterota bacterium]
MIIIREGTIQDAVTLSRRVPELDRPYDEAEYVKRLATAHHLILIAENEGRALGFKVGYDRYGDGSFYSWMGGVLPDSRRRGIARRLQETQEAWACQNGYDRLRVKTRKKHTAMIQFLRRSGFTCREKIQRQPAGETRLIFEKSIP